MAKTIEQAQDNVLYGFEKETRNAGKRTFLNATEQAILQGQKNREKMEKKKKSDEHFVPGVAGFHGISEEKAKETREAFAKHMETRDQEAKERAKRMAEKKKAEAAAKLKADEEAKEAAFKRMIAKKAQEQIAARKAAEANA